LKHKPGPFSSGAAPKFFCVTPTTLPAKIAVGTVEVRGLFFSLSPDRFPSKGAVSNPGGPDFFVLPPASFRCNVSIEMSRSIKLLAVPHELQGPKFSNPVIDPDYRILIGVLVRKPDQVTRGTEFVFEEAAGKSPSIAEEVAESVLGPGHYVDVDPAPSEREKYGIGPTEYCGLIDDWQTAAVFYRQVVAEHEKREKLWLERIQARAFEGALLICGLAHSLSFTSRLQSAGFNVETCHYLPYDKLCKKKHVK
jgi:hypothetical protein